MLLRSKVRSDECLDSRGRGNVWLEVRLLWQDLVFVIREQLSFGCDVVEQYGRECCEFLLECFLLQTSYVVCGVAPKRV